MQFSNTSGLSTPTDLIPQGFLCWAMLTMRGMKDSQSTSSRYADLELTVADKQPLARKKLWTKVADPDHAGNSEAYRTMGMTSLTRMIEAAGLVNPKDPDSYGRLSGKSTQEILLMLDGKYVAIKVKIETGEGGYADKNDVGDYLTPNEKSSSYKNYVKLTGGDHGVTIGGAAAKPAGGFGSGSAAPVVAQQSGGFQSREPLQPQGQSDRPLDTNPAQTLEKNATPLPSSGGFNPNSAPAFLRNHNSP